MSIRKYKRELLEFVEALCAECTLEPRGSGHILIRMAGPLGKRCVTVASTPSDGRANLNARAQIKRTAREIGCVPA